MNSDDCQYCEDPEHFGLSARKECKTGWVWKNPYDLHGHEMHHRKQLWGHEDRWGCVIHCKNQSHLSWRKKK